MNRIKNGHPVFTTLDAQPLAQALYPQFPKDKRKNVSAETSLVIEEDHAVMGLAINGKTAVPAWLGESMD